MLGCRRRQGMRRKGGTEAILGWKRETAGHPPPRLAGPPQAAHPHGSRRESRQYLCGYIDIIYSLSRNRHCRIAAPRFISAIQGFCAVPPRIRPFPPDSQRPTPFDHQKHTNWSQIMHESPQSACFIGLHCNACIGDILLCLFLF